MSAAFGLTRLPVVCAPMAGGVTTPELVAAVSNAGGLGFVDAGYRSADGLRTALAATREFTREPVGVNVFAPSGGPADPLEIESYAQRLAPLAEAAGAELGTPRFDDDDYAAKVELLLAGPPAVVSFTFGCPAAAVVAQLQAAGAQVWVTITSPDEARVAAAAGADAIVAQGAEAGGHRGAFEDPGGELHELTELLWLLRPTFAGEHAPAVIAAGGLMSGADIAGALACGAVAAQLGSAFLLADEAGTSPAQRAAVASDADTTLTRAFTGRLARGIVNGWTAMVGAGAPVGYPEVHHLTAPLRRHGRAAGNADLINLWAGVHHHAARAESAAAIVARVAAELAQAQRTPH